MNPPPLDIPTKWSRHGLVIPRAVKNDGVVGDPCIVWDDEINTWRMFVFRHPGGDGQAVCLQAANGLPTQWSPLERIPFTDSSLHDHKPYIVQEAHHPNRAAKINGEYWLVSVIVVHGRKHIQRARATSLAGPWRWDAQPLIPQGGPGAFDEKHTDAVTGFYFPERNEVLYYYMGYPATPQKRAVSPWGNAQGYATQLADSPTATKHGEYLPPCPEPGHWASGWLGGLQIFPGKTHKWVALLNASPTAPVPEDNSVAREEPAPSLGGWAWCDEEWPVKNWHFAPQPMEWVKDIPPDALADGESTNLWRHHGLVLPDGRVAVYYNSGYYGQEQLYLKVSAS
jgi:hypothetical protein